MAVNDRPYHFLFSPIGVMVVSEEDWEDREHWIPVGQIENPSHHEWVEWLMAAREDQIDETTE